MDRRWDLRGSICFWSALLLWLAASRSGSTVITFPSPFGQDPRGRAASSNLEGSTRRASKVGPLIRNSSTLRYVPPYLGDISRSSIFSLCGKFNCPVLSFPLQLFQLTL